jgi:Spx/MgsR family transcriptional regulator
MITLYGIKNCDTVRKARRWLDEQSIAHQFHDFRADGLEPALLEAWADQLGWEPLLNRRGTTYRQLPPERTASLDRAAALALMLEQPALIKRPVVVRNDEVRVGFQAADWLSWLKETA